MYLFIKFAACLFAIGVCSAQHAPVQSRPKGLYRFQGPARDRIRGSVSISGVTTPNRGETFFRIGLALPRRPRPL